MLEDSAGVPYLDEMDTGAFQSIGTFAAKFEMVEGTRSLSALC